MKRTATIAAVLLATALGGISLDLTRPTSLIAKAAVPDPAANAGDYTYTTSVASTEGATTDIKATAWGAIERTYR